MSGAGTEKAMKALAGAAKKACGKAVIDTKIAFGETTLTVRGDGRGGRNVEYLLAHTLALAAIA